jgi:hypothetical protein
MADLEIGDVVRVVVIGKDAKEVDHFAAALLNGGKLSEILAPMPQRGEAKRQDFGTWQVVQEFIILTTSGLTTTAIAAGIHAMWKGGHAEGQLPAPPLPTEEIGTGTTPHPQAIAASEPRDGVIEIVIRLHR